MLIIGINQRLAVIIRLGALSRRNLYSLKVASTSRSEATALKAR